MPRSAKTLEERYGFKDDDLKLKSHDDIMQWVDAHGPHILAQTYNLRNAEFSKCEVQWEVPVTKESGGKFIIGFVDAIIRGYGPDYDVPITRCPQCGDECQHPREHLQVRTGSYVRASVKWPEIRKGYVSHSVAVEAKTRIDSLGALLRQLNMYRAYLEMRFCLVTPANLPLELMQRQGITVINPESEIPELEDNDHDRGD